MKKLKRVLVVLVLLIGCSMWFVSCSCSKKPTDPEHPTTPDDNQSNNTAITYVVSVSCGAGGVYSSSTGSDTHRQYTAPVYTFTPNVGFAVDTVTLDGAVAFTHEAKGYNNDPVEITLSRIDANHALVVTFHQMDFFVEVENLDAGFAVSDGGTVVSSDGAYQHKGGSSPVYTITPKLGYCVYSLKVDGKAVFNYDDDPTKAVNAFTISNEFSEINADHSISVEFYKLVDVESSIITKYYYSGLTSEPTLETDIDSVSARVIKYGNVVACGVPARIELSVGAYFRLSTISVTLDGENYTEEFSATEDYVGDGFRFNSSLMVIEFDAITDKTNIKTYSTPESVEVLVYDYDNKSYNPVPSGKTLYSYYILPSGQETYYWYYSTSGSHYDESNTYLLATITSSTIDENTIYHILLDRDMISNGGNIILIFSKTNLKA